MRAIGSIVVLNLALAGCALQTPPTQTEVVDQALPEGTRIPAAWKADADTGAVADHWLKSFHDPVLDAMVAEALANNLDLRQAVDRVAIARQSAVVVGAQLLPQIGGQLGAKKTHDFGHEDEVKHTFSHTVASLGVAWELDVWGRLRAQRAAATAAFEATALDFAYARQSLAATVALSWYLTTEARQLLALAERAVEVYGKLLDLAKIRQAAGKSSDLDVVDARARLETAQSELEAARNTYGKARRALELLLGRYPAAEIEAAAVYPPLPPPVGAGVPASLLQRRPDLVAAERLVLAAFRQEEAARLALLPDLSISLVGERLGDHLIRQLRLSPWLASAAIGMAIPIYEGGALRAQVKIATAQQAQAVANYGSVVLNAFREVEDVLASEQILEKRLGYEQHALVDRNAAVQLAIEQYQAGRRDLLWVEQLQSEQIGVESNVIQLRNAQIANRIQLHLALGGSFDAAPSVAEPAGGK
ncbi:MAG: TolC family protein [Gammaproteobacteria bacterium]|jgi:NodT family efflux transporter outer membrane factor (OMF) lipoprotein|nr:TolC family protein [Gammaproteobacteria bacterium]